MNKSLLTEQTLPYKLLVWFTVITVILILHSGYSIRSLGSVDQSIVTVHETSLQVNQLNRQIVRPIVNIRMLSMELVLAPNKKLRQGIDLEICAQLSVVDTIISDLKSRFNGGTNMPNSSVVSEFKRIQRGWIKYKGHLRQTRDYVDNSIRVAAFINVTVEEKDAYEELRINLDSFNANQLRSSDFVYNNAQEESSFLYWTLIVTTAVEVVLLICIMVFVLRMVRRYIRLKQEYEKELNEAMAKANSANQAKSNFLANMSHEIRTPMNAVLGFTEILRKRETDVKKIHYIDNIHTSGQALLNLINDILDLSKIESGKLELECKPVSIASLLREMETIFENKICDKGLVFVVDCAENIPEVVILDEGRIRQILINLLGNAIKFTHVGEITLRVSVPVGKWDVSRSLNLIFEVSDSGVGIASDQHEKIFGTFQQAQGQKTDQYGGTGLGLAITRRLVEMMDGEITVESQVGKGSLFTVTLAGVEICSAGLLKTSRDNELEQGEIHFENATILIADDIDYNREILSTYLEPYDFKVLYAVNGKETIEQVRKHHPDLVLLDMKMPEMDGYEVAQIIKNDQDLKHISLIAVTASALKQDEDLISEVCDSYLRKPVSSYELVGVMAEFLPHTVCEVTEVTEEITRDSSTEVPPPTVDDIAGLDKQLRSKLEDALLSGNISTFTELLNESNSVSPSVTKGLLKLADSFELEVLESLFKH